MMKDTKQNQERKHDSEKGRKIAPSRIISNLVLVIAIGVFCFSGYKLFTIFSEYHKWRNTMNNKKAAAILAGILVGAMLLSLVLSLFAGVMH
jgi:F0F1-type ATP synthase assembly protein I